MNITGIKLNMGSLAQDNSNLIWAKENFRLLQLAAEILNISCATSFFAGLLKLFFREPSWQLQQK